MPQGGYRGARARMEMTEKQEIEVLEAAPKKAIGQLVPLRLRPKAISLKTLGAVRREMQKVYTDTRRGRLDSQEGARLVYMLSMVGKVLEAEMMERLEASLGDDGGANE